MKKLILMICTSCLTAMTLNAEFPITKQYIKTKEHNESIANSGKPYCSLEFFDLEIENLNGTKYIFGNDKQTDSDIRIDISKYNFINNEGSLSAYIVVSGELYKSESFRAIKGSSNSKDTSVMWFSFDGKNPSQLMVFMYSDQSLIIGEWVFYE